MALVVADRVKETTTSTGTGTINLAGAVTGFQTFVAGVGDTNTTYYAIIDPAGGTWEVGIGTVTDATPDTLSRDTIIASSNSGSAVSFGAGNKNVFSTQPADKAVYLDSSGRLVIGGVAVTSTAAELNYVDGVTSNIQTQLDSKLNLSGGTMTGALTLSGAPTADNHATTKIYVDDLIAAGIHYHDPVRVESPDSAGSLNATYDNGTNGVGATLTNNGTQAALAIDGVTLSTNDRVLIYNQTNAFENGIYTVTNTGSASTNWVLTRATDADSYGIDNQSLSEGTSVFVLEGDDGSGEVYACTTTGTITFGTTAINFSQIGKSAVITGGTGITVASNEVSANVSATTQTTAANSVTTTASRTYAVQPDSSDNLVVNVPWTDTTTNQTITLSGDASGSGTTSISVSLATDSVGSDEIAANAVSASELNVTGDGTTSQFLRSDGDGSFTWATPTDTTANETITLSGDVSGSGTTSISVSLATDSVGSNEIAANAVSASELNVSGNGTTTQFLRSDGDGSFTWATPPDNDTTYSVATSGTLGLVKIGYTENGKNYPVELSSGQMFVNVPWTDTTNAATLDGIDSSQFLRSDANDTASGDLTFNGKITAADPDFANQLEIYRSGGANYSMIKYSNTGGELGKIGFTDTQVPIIRLGTGTANNTIWHSGNDGSGSGLDADTVDGQHASSFIRNDTSNSVTNYANKVTFFSNTNAATTSGSQASLECYSSGAGNDAFMAFHVGGDYATYFGLDGDTNDLFVGGWSKGASRYKIWHAGNDGSGSGLDADTLDGVQGSSYLRSDTSDTFSGILTVDGSIALASQLYHLGDTDTKLTFTTDTITLTAGNQNEITINTTGVRLGDSGNGYFQPVTGSYGSVQIDQGAHNSYEGYSIGGRVVFMHNNGVASGLYNDVNNHWMFYGELNGRTGMYYQGSQKIATTSTGASITGSLTASGDVTAFSDIRLKENVETIDNALEKVQSLRGVTYTKDGKDGLGVIAQEVEEVLPEVVATTDDEIGTKSVAYGNIVGLLIEAVKEQQEQINSLKNEINELKGFK